MLLEILNLLGVISCAVTGALAAGKVKMDYFGVLIISMVTALGGGTLRDVVLHHYPLSWVADVSLLYVVTVSSIITIILAPFMMYLNYTFLVFDAIGMVAFSLLGAQVALDLNYGYTLCCLAGVATGSFGGVIRDILCNRIPVAFQNELYASIALVTVSLYYVLLQTGLPVSLTIIITLIFGITFRLLAIKYNWSLPIFEYDEDKYSHQSWQERLPHNRLKKKMYAYKAKKLNADLFAVKTITEADLPSVDNNASLDPQAEAVQAANNEVSPTNSGNLDLSLAKPMAEHPDLETIDLQLEPAPSEAESPADSEASSKSDSASKSTPASQTATDSRSKSEASANLSTTNSNSAKN